MTAIEVQNVKPVVEWRVEFEGKRQIAEDVDDAFFKADIAFMDGARRVVIERAGRAES